MVQYSVQLLGQIWMQFNTSCRFVLICVCVTSVLGQWGIFSSTGYLQRGAVGVKILMDLCRTKGAMLRGRSADIGVRASSLGRWLYFAKKATPKSAAVGGLLFPGIRKRDQAKFELLEVEKCVQIFFQASANLRQRAVRLMLLIDFIGFL